MGDQIKIEPEIIILKSHNENGITIIDEFKFSGMGLIIEEEQNDKRN